MMIFDFDHRLTRQNSPPADADEQLLKLRLGERAVSVLLPVIGVAAVHVVHAFLQPADLVEGVVTRLLHEYVCWKDGRSGINFKFGMR